MPTYLPASVLRPPITRHFGFLNYNRRLLALGAVAACGLLTSIQSLPAGAEVVHDEAAVSVLQSFDSSATFLPVIVQRDGFGITAYTLVQWPVPSTTTMSDGFGPRSCAGCSADHKGIDLTPGTGYPIQAVADGVVTEARSDIDGLGVHIIIQHVIDGQVFSTLYAHMQAGSLALSVGEAVARGQQLGTVGDTGSSTGPHLHFGVLGADGIEIDPQAWLLQHANSPVL